MAAFFTDTATVSEKKSITAHTTDSGHTWVKFAGIEYPPNVWPVNGGVITVGANGSACWRSSVIAPGADVKVTQSLKIDNASIANVFGVAARMNAEGTAGYVGAYARTKGRWVIAKFTGANLAAEDLALGSPRTYANNVSVACDLRVSGAGAAVTIELFVDGVSTVTATDTSATRVVDAGYVGFWLDSTDDGSGAWIDRIDAELLVIASATALTLSGPSTAVIGAASSPFTVTANGALASSVTITPNDSGGGGSFAPSSLAFGPGATTGSFTYTASSAGAKSISITNNGALTNPSAVSFSATDGSATAIALSGPSAGETGSASSVFTVSANGVLASNVTVSMTAADGVFAPTSVALSPGNISGTFTYTPATAGNKSITLANTGGLTNPASFTYEALPSNVQAPFPPSVADRVRDTASAASGSSITLNATPPKGHQTFSSAFPVGTKNIPVLCEDTAGNWMIVECELVSSTTLAVGKLVSSSTPGSVPSFVAGEKTVFCVMPAKLAFKARSIDLSDYAIYPDFSGDSTAGVQQAILDAYERRIEKIIAPPGHFRIGGALNVGSNSQIYTPQTRMATPNRSIWIDGISPPNYENQGLWPVDPAMNGTVFESTIVGSGSRPSVFGAMPGNSSDAAVWNYTNFSMTNLGIRVKADNPTAHKMSAINMEFSSQVPVLDNLSIGVNKSLGAMRDPTGGGSIGVKLPPVNNHAVFNIGSIYIAGYETGISASEHTYIDHAILLGCVNGIVLEPAHHASRFNMLTMEHVKNSIVVNGHHPLSIGLYETEHNTTIAWCAHAYDIFHITGDRKIAYLRTSIVIPNVGNAGDTAHADFHSNNPNIYKIFVGPGSA